MDLRTRIVQAYERKEGGYIKLGRRFSVATSTVRRWVDRMRELGRPLPRKRHTSYLAKIPNKSLPDLQKLVEEKPDRTIEELAVEWTLRTGVELSSSSMGRALQRASLTLKKNFSFAR